MKRALAILFAACSTGLFAADDTAAPAAAVADAPPTPAAVAQERRRLRLLREVAALERELAAFPAGLEDEAGARDRARVAAGLEVWDITAERSDLRARIDHLRERITLLEQIQQRQDDLDRARLVEHQRVLADVGSERAVARLNEDEAVLDVQSSTRLLAAAQAKREMLARLRGQLDAIVAQPGALPVAPTAPPATVAPAPVISSGATPENVPAITVTPVPAVTPAPAPTPEAPAPQP